MTTLDLHYTFGSPVRCSVHHRSDHSVVLLSLGLEPYLAPKTPTLPSAFLRGDTDYVIDVDGVCFRTRRLLHAGDIFSRATVVYEANLLLPEGSSGTPGKYVPHESPSKCLGKHQMLRLMTNCESLPNIVACKA